MIPQWDGLFRALGATDYPEMLQVLSDAWAECRRVLVPGGILAVNIGDALRTVRGEFRIWPNPAETIRAVTALGLVPLPYILWKKPTNRPNAFLGSGFLPPNAYVTLDCEYVLLFRNGPLRRFPRHDTARLASRFSRVERDLWFSQVWSDIRGARQGSPLGRSGAFPRPLANVSCVCSLSRETRCSTLSREREPRCGRQRDGVGTQSESSGTRESTTLSWRAPKPRGSFRSRFVRRLGKRRRGLGGLRSEAMGDLLVDRALEVSEGRRAQSVHVKQ